MALIQIDATADVLQDLREISELYIVTSTVEDLGASRYRVSAYAPEEVFPDLEARGCTVRVMMSTQSIDEFHRHVESTIAPPPEA